MSIVVANEEIEKKICISRIWGTVERARGLCNTKLLVKSAPRCYVKGIKGNSHLVTFFCSQVGRGNNPQWNEPWEYDCLKTRSRDEFVGLKFVVYDGEDFIGGADLDISSIQAYRTVTEEVELAGVVQHHSKGTVPKKARLFITCSVERKFLPSFERPQTMLLGSMRSASQVISVCGRIIRARGLCSKLGKRSLPMCTVRCYMNSGKIVDKFNTKCHRDVVDPNWDEAFEIDFDEDEWDQPLMLVFDIWGSAGKDKASAETIKKYGDHLGSAMIPVASIKDEAAFVKGEARHKVQLLGESQLIEKRLDRDEYRRTVAAKTVQEEDFEKRDAHLAPKNSWPEWASKMKMPQFGGGHKTKADSYYITAEVFAERRQRVMPHSELLTDSVVIEEGDLEGDNPTSIDDELKSFFKQESSNGERVKRLQITAEERITTIYGRVMEANDLIASDVTGKSDPYVIVEALTKLGELLFVYRTRCIPANLNPQWNEAFFWKVPPDPDNPRIPVALSKLQFSIFDSDEGQIVEQGLTGVEDDFLGRCSVDIGFMRNSDFLIEEIPLLGCKARPGGYKSKGGFRRNSNICAEVRVERRAMRIVDVQHNFDARLLDCHRHHESRPMHPPEFKGYRDFSQLLSQNDLGMLDDVAKTVLMLRDTNALLDSAKIHKKKQIENQGWLKVRPSTSQFDRAQTPSVAPVKPLTAPPSGRTGSALAAVERRDGVAGGGEQQAAPSSRRRDWKTLWNNWNDQLHHSLADFRNLDHVNRLPPMKRTGSLPILSTRFGENYEKNILDPFEEHVKRSSKFIPPRMCGDTVMCDTVMQGLQTKPLVEDYALRRDIRTAPAKASTML